MNRKIFTAFLAGATMIAAASTAFSAGTPLPGDNGRMMDGIFPANPPPRPPGPMPKSNVRAPAIHLALEAAQAIANGCKQYTLGIAVVNAEGVPTLVYIPDGSGADHAYTAIRKAYTAVTFKTNTSGLVTKAQQDADFAAKIKADPNLMAFKGGIVLKVGDEVIGAIGVSGAEPGGHDEECGLKGYDKIKDQLK